MRIAAQISWTAREAFAVAYCWSEFAQPEAQSSTPEQYWLGISERSRNECRAIANDLLFLAVARNQAVAVLPAYGLKEGQLAKLTKALGMTKEHRVRAILDAVRQTFTVDRRASVQPTPSVP